MSPPKRRQRFRRGGNRPKPKGKGGKAPPREATAKEGAIEMEGKVTDCLPNLTFRIELPNGHRLLARLAGRMRRNRIRVSLGDEVKVEISPYDLERGRIIYRL